MWGKWGRASHGQSHETRARVTESRETRDRAAACEHDITIWPQPSFPCDSHTHSEPSSTQQSVRAAASTVLRPITMSCGGCGCCPKCGCRATCTCNRNIFTLENPTDFSGMSFTVANENDGQLHTAQGAASLSCYTVAQGANGGECVNCGWHAPGSCA